MPEQARRRRLRVLQVEDSEKDAELLRIELRRGGYDPVWMRVDTADDLRDAVKRYPWDVVLCDYSMPGFDALRALTILRDGGHDLPVLVISGTIGEETAVGALHAGAHDFLVKGQLARLIPAIERGLAAHESARARRAAELALKESEQRYRDIVETTREGVWVLDADRRATFVNRRVAEMLGFPAGDLLGRTPFEFVQPESLETVERALSGAAGDPGSQSEVKLRRTDDRDLWVLMDATPLSGTDGRTLVMMVDVTHRRSLEEQLRQAQKMEAVGTLAGGVAHDLNNLLSVIMTYTELAIEELPPSDPIRAELMEVVSSSDRARALTAQLLALSRRQVVEPQTLDPNELITGMDRMLRRLLGGSIELTVLADPDAGNIFADPGQVEQIIMNLVVNAKDAMPEGGRLLIETGSCELDDAYCEAHHGVVPGAYVMLAVTDTGVGMDARTRERIFEPFFTTKEKGRGTGLGLSTVFGMVKQSEGHLWVYSELGQGTTFRVYLPRTDRLVEAAARPAPPQTLRGVETILLAEDETPVRTAIRIVLDRLGYTVIESSSGGDALLASEKHRGPIHLLLTDVVMPRMNGPELAARIRRHRPGIKVLYLSGYTQNTVLHHSMLEEGASFLSKPITPTSLSMKVRELLNAPSLAPAR